MIKVPTGIEVIATWYTKHFGPIVYCERCLEDNEYGVKYESGDVRFFLDESGVMA